MASHFTVPDDDYEESSFQSASTDPNDILVPTNQIDVPPFVLTEDDVNILLRKMMMVVQVLRLQLKSTFQS